MTDQNTHHSSYREMLLEHLFVGGVMRHLWLRKIAQFEVLKPQVDDSGYDLVLEANGFVRHVQLKASASDSSTAEVKVSLRLAAKPSGCVIWMHFDPKTMELGPFLWYGGSPGYSLPDISKLPIAKHTKANSLGIKLPRQGHRVLRRSAFQKVSTWEGIVDRLFGAFAEAGPAV